MTHDLKNRILRGGLVSISAQIVTLVLRTGSLVVLARLITPLDYGLVGMVTAVTGVLAIFKTAGLTVITVQRSSITTDEISTLFWLNILVGVVLLCLCLGIAPVLVGFYHESRLFWLTAVLGTGFVFTAAGAQHQALLQRRMQFVRLAVVDILSLSISVAVAIIMAASGYGYWALAWMQVIEPAVGAVMSWLLLAWIPGVPKRGVGAFSMLLFGGKLSLSGLMGYLANNADKVLLGRVYGAEVLGNYGRAFQLIAFPIDILNSGLGTVALSGLSRIQNDPERFKKYFLRGYSLVVALTLPVAIAFASFADDIILVVLGPKWKDVAFIFRVLTPIALAFALRTPFSWLLFATGQAGKILKMGLVVAPVMILGYAIGLPYGPGGVAVGYSATAVLLIVPMIAWAKHGTSISWRDVLQSLSRPLLSAIVSAGASIALQLSYAESMPPFVRLGMGVAVLLGLYLFMLLYVFGQKETYADFLRTLRRSSSSA